MAGTHDGKRDQAKTTSATGDCPPLISALSGEGTPTLGLGAEYFLQILECLNFFFKFVEF